MFDLDMQMSIEAAYKYSEDIEEDIQNGLIEDKNKGCALPILDPFDKEAVKLDKATPTGSAVCEEPDLIECYHKFKVFRDSLTDHYVLPLLKEVFGDTAEGNRSFCLGGTPLYRTLLNLTHQFLQLNGNRFSFTFISDITNNNFNMGSEADEVLSSFLYNLQQDTKMQETVLFVMSDHGSR
ncbi:hypothetical protein MSG28_015717 [Choristoneura fumiferana]|uniref:Uncharacterized protein n=1 Tax=Choristoneura fumiferana TaxID=7141 RepID=A0ACC0KC01_CHOFU|nr:hypothetical protein MSG28_015717 [Choristoneura fumiferana]